MQVNVELEEANIELNPTKKYIQMSKDYIDEIQKLKS